MGIRYFIIAAIFAMMLSGCGPSVSLWRHDATLVIDRVRMEGADRAFPEEFGSAEEAMKAGETLFRQDELEKADALFLLAWTKGKLLEEQLKERKRRENEARRRADAAKLEQHRRLKEQQEEAQHKLQIDKPSETHIQPDTKKKGEKPRPTKDRPLPSHHTAKRGETLPLIAAQIDVYNDPALWPLLYRANRDQIKDPRHIWPGQVLRIPRNLSRDDLIEARRYSQERPIY